jgi:hypothetical protein
VRLSWRVKACWVLWNEGVFPDKRRKNSRQKDRDVERLGGVKMAVKETMLFGLRISL